MIEHIAHITGWQKLFPDQINGLRTSNESFLKAILTYSKIKKIDLFIPAPFIQHFEEEWHPFLQNINRIQDISLHRLWDIPAYIGSQKYDLALLGDPLIYKMAELRNQIAKTPFPICGITHSLHGFGEQIYNLQLLLSKTQPYDSIICTSQAGKKALEQSFILNTKCLSEQLAVSIPPPQCKLAHIPLGIETIPPTGLTQNEAKKAIDLPESDPLILCNGRISILNKMDHTPLLIALKNITQITGLENTRLLIAGAVEMNSQYLNALAFKITQMGLDKHVFFKLNYHTAIKGHLYEAADVVVSLPDNIQETFGVAPVEAMLMGRPVILSNWNGHGELLEDKVSGYLIPTYWSQANPMTELAMPYCSDQILLYLSQSVAIDVPLLTERLKTLLLSPELRKKIGQAGKKHAQNQFTWEKIIPKYDELWNELHQISHHSPTFLSAHRNTPLTSKIHQIFSHYASHDIQADDILSTTPYGIRILNKEETINLYPTVLTWIDADNVFNLLKIAQRPQPLSELLKQIPHEPSLTTYIILWAMKNDLIQLNASTNA